MKKTLQFCLVIAFLFVSCYSFAQNKQTEFYERKFVTIDSLALSAKPTDALLLISSMVDQARKDGNTNMLLKSIIYRMLFKGYTSEDMLIKNIGDLKIDIEKARQPAKSILQSLLAESYWKYYQQNVYQIYNRTPVAGNNSDDIKTWDIKKLLSETVKNYQASLAEEKLLQGTGLDHLGEIIMGDTLNRYLRPTLYDVLAHRALDTYMNAQISIGLNGAKDLNFDDAKWMQKYQSFLKEEIPDDSTSVPVMAVKILKSLILFHQNDVNVGPLADADLKRINLLYRKGSGNSRYLNFYKALENIISYAKGSEIVADAYFNLASLCKDGSEIGDLKDSLTLIKAIKFSKMAIDRFPKSVGALNAEKLIAQIKMPGINFTIAGNCLPNKSILINYQYKNIDSLHLTLYKANIGEQSHQLTNENEYSNFVKQKGKIRSWKLTLPKQIDYKQHHILDKIDPLPAGNYFLFAQTDTGTVKTGSAHSLISFQVSGMIVSKRFMGKNSHEYYVVNSSTGLPVAKAKIEEKHSDYRNSKREWITSAVLETDDNGTVVSNARDVHNATVSKGNDSLVVNVVSRYYYEDERNKKLLIFTDRGIYRPGQTVFFKGIFLSVENDQNKILVDQAVDFEVKDPNYTTIETFKFITNDFGTFQGSFVIPRDRLTGQMTFLSPFGRASVQVEEYKRPTFEVNFDKLDKKYRLNDSVKVTGKVTSFAGYPVVDAKIAYKIIRTLHTRFYSSPNVPAPKQIAFGETNSKSGGNFALDFFAKADEDFNGYYSYELSVTITDLNGETQTKVQKINIGKNDIQLRVFTPEPVILTSKNDSIPFIITNLNNQNIKGKLVVVWYPLVFPGKVSTSNPFGNAVEDSNLTEQQFARYFPDYAFRSAEPEHWKKGTLVLNQQYETSDGNGNIIINQKLLKEGYYSVELGAVNAEGDSVSAKKIVRIFGKELTEIQTTGEWITTIKKEINPNEEALFRLASLNPNGNLYYEVYYNNKVVERVWTKLSPKQTLIKIKPQAGFKEVFAVQFSLVQNGMLYQSLQKIVIVNKSDQLDINFLSFRDKLEPGEKETWKVRITNKLGEKQAAEMVATLYDASLDALQPFSWNTSFKSSYNYDKFSWDANYLQNQNSNYFWFLRRYNDYLDIKNRNYEQINLYNYNYANYGYNDYLRNAQLKLERGLSKITARKLADYAKRGLLCGIIKDNHGYALPGVVVSFGKNTTVADNLGIYAIDVRKGTELRFSFIGYTQKKITVGDSKRLDVILMEDQLGLSEIVVAGYGTRKRENVTGSVATVLPEPVGEGPARRASIIKNEASAAKKSIAFDDNKTYDFVSINYYDPVTDTYIIDGRPIKKPSNIAARTNFAETAFFCPQLHTNSNGEIIIDFTIPQSLTRYKMIGFAHTKDLKAGSITTELVTQKQFAVSANAPRFFREGDTILLSAKLNNLSGKTQEGKVILELKDGLTGKSISIFDPETEKQVPFELQNAGNIVVKWKLIIPEGIRAITYKIMAAAGKYSDGEEMTIPVLPNSMLVTESMPISVRGGQRKTFKMNKLINNKSTTLRNHSLTFEFTENPVWYAVQALPYLMEYPYECAEQTFSRFYANSFATGIINSSPGIKQAFDSWRDQQNGEALLSKLEKTQELKSILLEETPWVQNANNETERKKRLATLFDLNRMTYELKRNFEKLEKMQYANGVFPWFDGMPEDRYITQHIVLGMGQLKHLKLIDEKAFPGFNKVMNKAIIYLDSKLENDYRLEVNQKQQLYFPLHYLYARSYSEHKNNNANFNKALNYYLNKIVSGWKSFTPYQLGQAALILQRNGKQTEARKLIELLRQTAQQNDEMGMYWANNVSGWWWYESPVETQALLIEAFDEVAKDTISVEEMKVWLLKNKQTNDWKTTKATTAACYALLMHGYDLLNESTAPDVLLGGQKLESLVTENIAKEAGTGYQKVNIPKTNIVAQMGNVDIKNNSKTFAYGALYWQYFEQLDKITQASTGIKIRKDLFLLKQTKNGDELSPLKAQQLKVGDLIKVRVEISTDRAMEYLHLKDMRSSGFEPVNVISRYKYQDGLSYYESTKDAATNFFIGYMPKGTYVFEYPLRVTHSGNFSNGITTLQSMYAPEFTTHSQGIRVGVN